MRWFRAGLIALLLGGSFASVALAIRFAQQSKPATPLYFEQAVLQLGQVRQHPEIKAELKLHHQGNKAARLGRIVTTCGCTVGTLPQESFSPGGSLTIPITWNAHGRRGLSSVDGVLEWRFEGDDRNNELRFQVRGEVLPAFVSDPERVEISVSSPLSEAQLPLIIRHGPGWTEGEIVKVESTHDLVLVELDSNTRGSATERTVRLQFRRELVNRTIPSIKIVVHTTAPGEGIFSIPVEIRRNQKEI
jgi:hypothetical protein